LGPKAAAFVVAHVVGHHVSNLRTAEVVGGTRGRADESPRARLIRAELVADCHAGVFFGAEHPRSQSLIGADDIEEAVYLVAVVGEDEWERPTGQGSRPESFNHGTRELRQAALKQGMTERDCEAIWTWDLTAPN